MHLADVLGRRLTYEDDDSISCDIELDILPAEAPEVVYAMLGRLRNVKCRVASSGRQYDD